VFYAWAGFAWDSRRGHLLIHGGGHGNYSGNEVYRWNGATLRWERASLPSDITPAPSRGAWLPLDGPMNAPVSSHAYDSTLYLPAADRLWLFGQGMFPDGGPHKRLGSDGKWLPTGPYLFDPAKADPNKVGGTEGSGVDPGSPGGRMWQNRDLFSVMKARGTRFPESHGCGTSDALVENGRDVIYMSAAYGGTPQHYLFRHTMPDIDDPTKDTWEVVGRPGADWGCISVGALDRANNLYIRTAKDVAPDHFFFTYWDLNFAGPMNRARGITRGQLRGAPDFMMTGLYGMDYDPPRKRLLLWSGGSQVWALTIKEGIWEIGPTPTSAPAGYPSPSLVAIMGKWKYNPSLDIFMALEDNGDVWSYKPTGWLDPVRKP
jgi:hypothetical protein